jgi:hypothetical protein
MRQLAVAAFTTSILIGATPCFAEGEPEQRVIAACAAYDLQAVSMIEERGKTASASDLVGAFDRVLTARAACRQGQGVEGLSYYAEAVGGSPSNDTMTLLKKACAAYDLQLLSYFEEQGRKTASDAQEVSDRVWAVIGARSDCGQGRFIEALRLYDQTAQRANIDG